MIAVLSSIPASKAQRLYEEALIDGQMDKVNFAEEKLLLCVDPAEASKYPILADKALPAIIALTDEAVAILQERYEIACGDAIIGLQFEVARTEFLAAKTTTATLEADSRLIRSKPDSILSSTLEGGSDDPAGGQTYATRSSLQSSPILLKPLDSNDLSKSPANDKDFEHVTSTSDRPIRASAITSASGESSEQKWPVAVHHDSSSTTKRPCQTGPSKTKIKMDSLRVAMQYDNGTLGQSPLTPMLIGRGRMCAVLETPSLPQHIATTPRPPSHKQMSPYLPGDPESACRDRDLLPCELQADARRIVELLTEIHEGRASHYPPMDANLTLCAATERVIGEEALQLDFGAPLDTVQLQWLADRVCARCGIARMRGVTFLERVTIGSLYTKDGKPRKSNTGRELNYREAIGLENQSWLWTAYVTKWLCHAALPAFVNIQKGVDDGSLTRFRHIDLMDVIAHVASERFGWAWSPSKIIYILDDRNNTCKKLGSRTESESTSLKTLAHFRTGRNDVENDAWRPTYNVSRHQLLPEDRVALTRIQSQRMDVTNLSTLYSELTVLLASSPWSKVKAGEEGVMLGSGKSSNADAAKYKAIAERVLGMVKPPAATRDLRTLDLKLLRKAVVEPPVKEICDAIETASEGWPCGVIGVRAVGDKLVELEFCLEVLMWGAFLTLPKWTSVLANKVHGYRLTLPEYFLLPQALRAVAPVPTSARNAITRDDLFDRLDALGYQGYEVPYAPHVAKQVATDKVNQVHAIFHNWLDTLHALQETSCAGDSRMVLFWKDYDIPWCVACQTPGHTDGADCEVVADGDACQVCLQLWSADSQHPVQRRLADIYAAAQEQGASPCACPTRALLHKHVSTYWHHMIRIGTVGDGFYSLHPLGRNFRLGLKASALQAAGVRRPICRIP